MSIPKYDEIQIPALKLLKNGDTLHSTNFEKPLGEYFKLSDNEINEWYESGNKKIFQDRINWALSYLTMAGYLDKPKRGYFKINKNGLASLQDETNFSTILKSILDKREPTKRKKSETEIQANDKNDLTPTDNIEKSFDGIKKAIYREILDTILSKTPQEFERLVVELLQKMGYGGKVKNSGIVTPYSNDGGIDGIIKEDILGLGTIHIQAKRYNPKNQITREDIQKFVGAIASTSSSKGVFITTSYFNKNAIAYAEGLSSTSNIVLIDGQELAEYIYNYDLGMQTEKTFVIKKIDGDYWDTMQDNS